MSIKLNDCGVKFVEEPRGYHYGEKELQGISHIAREMIRDPYAGAPEFRMHEGAKRGNNLHSAISVFREVGIEQDSEVFRAYLNLTKGFEFLANEYTVSDLENFATRIDDVFSLEGKIILSNTKRVKSASSDLIDNWSWQSSIEAYLFELVNPHLKVDRLVAVQVSEGVEKLVELRRRASEEVQQLLTAYLSGGVFVDESKIITKDTDTALTRLLELEGIIATHKAEIDRVTKDAEVLKEFLKSEMLKSEVKKWETDKIIVTYVAPQERVGLDNKKVKEHYPEVFEECQKMTFVKDSLRITIKK